MHRPERQSAYLFGADIIRVLSVFLVVLLHTSAGYLYQWGKIPISAWWIGNLFDSLARICVPLFVMLSGSLLLAKTETYTVFWQKRVSKILLPWIFWTAIYVVWTLTFRQHQVFSFGMLMRLGYETFFGGFWFLVMLAGVYILTPLWRVFIRMAAPKDLFYLLILWFVFVSVLPLLNGLIFKQTAMFLPLSVQYSGYFLLGWTLKEVSFFRRIRPQFLLIIWLASSLVTVIGTYLLTDQHQAFNEIFYDFLSPFQVLSSVAVFLWLWFVTPVGLLKQIHLQSILKVPQLVKLTKSCADATFGIYFIHVIVLEIITIILSKWLPMILEIPLVAIPVLTLCVYGISFALIRQLRCWAFLRNFS